MKKLFKFFCFLFIIFVITIIGCFLYVKLSPKVTINSANNISLYDTNKTIYFKGNESKEWVDLDDISDYLIKSTIYTEDKNFYKHFGFDFLRIGKAILTNITSHSTNQGASTITQQYAKNLFLNAPSNLFISKCLATDKNAPINIPHVACKGIDVTALNIPRPTPPS